MEAGHSRLKFACESTRQRQNRVGFRAILPRGFARSQQRSVNVLKTPSSQSDSSNQSVEAFRVKTRKARLHPLEQGLQLAVLLQLVCLPWALGGMRLWAQVASLVLSGFAFVLAVLPRNYTGDFTVGRDYRLQPAARLLRFPPFWAGVCLLGYVAVQGMNPAWIYIEKGGHWWMQPIPHISWLPAGMETPFEKTHPFRYLITFGSVWLLGCSVWIGFTRRKSFVFLLSGVALNGVVLAAFGLVQKLAPTRQMFWTLDVSNSSFFASFIYPNHAAAYLNLVLGLAIGLTFWYGRRARQRMEKSSPAPLFALMSFVIFTGVVFSFSRMGGFMALALVLMTGIYLLARALGRSTDGAAWVVGLSLAALFLVFSIVLTRELPWEAGLKRYSQLFEENPTTIEARQMAHAATRDMLKENWVQGWGAGSFRFYFPFFAQHYPEIYRDGRLFWEYAHNDLLQFPTELGLIGMLPIVFVLGWGLLKLLRHRFWRHPLAHFVLLALSVLLVHSGVDFNLQNPAVLTLASILGLSAVRLIELESSRRSPAPARRS